MHSQFLRCLNTSLSVLLNLFILHYSFHSSVCSHCENEHLLTRLEVSSIWYMCLAHLLLHIASDWIQFIFLSPILNLSIPILQVRKAELLAQPLPLHLSQVPLLLLMLLQLPLALLSPPPCQNSHPTPSSHPPSNHQTPGQTALKVFNHLLYFTRIYEKDCRAHYWTFDFAGSSVATDGEGGSQQGFDTLGKCRPS